MPKMKTNSGAKKRLKLTGSGKIKRAKAYKRHLLGHKSKGRKEELGKSTVVHKSDEPRMKQLLGMA
jgi:large subunit ribosomal protein L35